MKNTLTITIQDYGDGKYVAFTDDTIAVADSIPEALRDFATEFEKQKVGEK